MTAGRKIVLIGPMGAGKTSLGRRLATRLRWEFTDTDHALCARTGVDIPTIFAAEGEAGFRKREHDVLADILAEPRDMVVACGGGIVLKAENLQAKLEQLRDERLGLYEGLADIRVDTDNNHFTNSFKKLLHDVENRLRREK